MIVRRRHTANFTTIGNAVFDDERLHADEVGILGYLLSRPHDWEVRRPALMRRWGIGREAVRRVIRNLVRYGYCRAERKRLENGTTFVIYEIRDEPGPELTEEEAKRVLALESSATASGQIDGETDPDDHVRVDDDPLTAYPSPGSLPPAEPSLAYIDIQNKDLTKDDSTQKAEREYARERERHAANLVEFKRRWPTSASDDQARIDHAWFDLSPDEGTGALAGIGPFVAKLKSDKRTTVPAGWKYLKEKRWTLLEQAATKGSIAPDGYARDSIEGKALACAFDIAGKSDAFFRIYVRDGRVRYLRPVTPRILALAETAPKDAWPQLTRQQAAAWEGLMREVLGELARRPIKEHDRAPHPWPPKVDGTWSSTDTPETYCTEQDMADFH